MENKFPVLNWEKFIERIRRTTFEIIGIKHKTFSEIRNSYDSRNSTYDIQHKNKLGIKKKNLE